MTTTTYVADLADIRAAAERIAPYAHRTPVATCATLDEMAGRALYFKCENQQKIGAFKFRGACNAVMKLDDAAAARGVVTHSSGNHAQAVALAAKLRGIPAHIVMPSNANAVKRSAVEGYGAKIYECAPTEIAREDVADGVVADTGGVLIPPFDHPDVIAGQGTAALELLADVPDLDAIITPVGGGGLMSGTALCARELKPQCRVFAAEPAGADDASQSKAAGAFVPQKGPDTICDGLRTSLGEGSTWPVLRDVVEEVLVANDAAVVEAMRLLWSRAKLVVETNAALGLAVALGSRFRELDGIERVGIVLTGGNVDLDNLPW